MLLKGVLLGLGLTLPLFAHAGFNEGLAAYMLKDYQTALTEWQQLARKGDAKAQFSIGMMYYWSQGNIKNEDNLTQAETWLRKAANQNYGSAQYLLGRMYLDGVGVPTDVAQGVAWFRKAAEQGDSQAQYILGQMSGAHQVAEWGNVVPRDDTQAAMWLRKAAEQGNAMAQNRLADMYRSGQGVIRDLVLAHMLYKLSGASGFSAAAFQSSQTASRLSPDQLQEAELLAAAWKVGTPLPAKSKTGIPPNKDG